MLEAKETTISEVFEGDRQYRIPNFQRPYRWGYEEARLLTEDLLAAWQRDDENYFLGSIVVVKNPAESRDLSSSNQETVEVIDGQQRLTTLSLMIAVLAEFFAADLTEKNDLSTLLLIPEKTILGIESRPRLRLRDEDAEFYENYVVGLDLNGLFETGELDRNTQAKNNLKTNAEVILEVLGQVMDRSTALEFIKYLLRRVMLVVVETDDYVAAHRIFGVLNTRGLELTASDIFKSRVIGEIPAEERDEYARIWDQYLEATGEDPDQFLRHLTNVLTRSHSKRSLIEEIDRVFDSGTPDAGRRFINEKFVPYAASYGQLSGMDSSLTEPVNKQLRLLSQYPSEDWKPVAIWVLTNLGEIDARAEALAELDRLFGVYSVARTSTDQRNSALVTALNQLIEADTAQSGQAVFEIPDRIKLDAVYQLKSEAPRGKLRTVVLTRAHLATVADRQAVQLPRRLNAVCFLSGESITGVPEGLNLNHWQQRLGSFVLTAGTQSRVTGLKTLASRRKYLEENALAQESPASSPAILREITSRDLQRRHEQLVEAVAGYWQITHDSEGVHLPRMSETQLLQMATGQRVSTARRVRLADVVNSGIIRPEDTFTWRRPVKGETHTMRVTQDGTLRLANGQEVDSPSQAVSALGSSAKALDVWVRDSDGRTLRDLWTTYQQRFMGG